MSYYSQGNLAVDVKPLPSVRKKQRTIKISPGIPTGEKLLYLFLITLVVVAMGVVGLRYLKISQHNYEIQSLTRQISHMKGQNETLKLRIDQMSNRDRIVSEAEKLGMIPSPDSVRVISNMPTSKKVETASID